MFRDQNGQIELKIGMFGFARCIGENSVAGSFADESLYKSPEYTSERRRLFKIYYLLFIEIVY